IGQTRHRNVSQLWQGLLTLSDDMTMTVHMVDEKLLIRLRNGGSWLICKENILRKHKVYTQILALDVTQEDILTRQVEQANVHLEKLGRELTQAIAALEQDARQQEIWRMKTRIHDEMGQRLSILQQYLQQEQTPEDLNQINTMMQGLLDVVAGESRQGLQQQLQALVQSFALIGTEIVMDGILPVEEVVADAFVKIIREAATNAVRHGRAKHITITVEQDDTQHLLSICNDGTLPGEPLKEGGGVMGMHYRVSELGGYVELLLREPFTVVVNIPKRGNNND
ncbi:hypothetical protein LJC55_04015, partial [Eubacteriales bacterium OttesenSCG-928-N14]|nr:hypothetical protein [Eubacteriales bacterium OttesenSCG-928-N14]